MVNARNYKDYDELFSRQEYKGLGPVQRPPPVSIFGRPSEEFNFVWAASPSVHPLDDGVFRNMQVSSNGDPAFSFVVLYNAHQAWLHIRGIHPRGALWSIWSPSECTHSNVQSTPANSVDLIKIPMEDVHTEIPQNIYFMGYEHDHDDADSSTYSKGAKSGARKQRAAEGADLSDQISRSLSPLTNCRHHPPIPPRTLLKSPPGIFRQRSLAHGFLSGLLSSGGNGSPRNSGGIVLAQRLVSTLPGTP
ncbi:hypothetical protein PCANC_26605 [Puccinia coronata f. sp. avenae]|uniref:Uncharacterized protein n=1 Tax=Puccinia coronata f. sp. avenae TaxID=200324 RepID=A0A2N5RWW0_9BASI|nr:hypothetical protein PCANC_26605 [Puccinia coronata f. sp. avenae]